MVEELLRIENGIMTMDGYDILAGIWIQIRKSKISGIISDEQRMIDYLFKVLTGKEQLNFGSIYYEGRRVGNDEAHVFFAEYVQLISGENHVLYGLSMAENMFLMSKDTRGILLKSSLMKHKLSMLFERFEIDMDINLKVSDMSRLQRYEFELLKAYMLDRKIILLDLHQSELLPDETKQLFTLINRMKEKGISFMIWDPVIAQLTKFSDHVMILKNGKTARVMEKEDLDEKIIEKVLLGDLKGVYTGRTISDEKYIFSAKGISDALLRDFNLNVRAKEISLLCCESTEILLHVYHILIGDDVPEQGVMLLNGEEYCPKGIEDAIKKGVAFIKDSSYKKNLFYYMTVFENICLVKGNYVKKIWRNLRFQKSLRNTINSWFGKDICDQRLDSITETELQKVLFSRWRLYRPKLLVLVNPFIGGCITMNEACMQDILEIAEQGSGILILSTNLLPYPSLNRTGSFLSRNGESLDGRHFHGE